MDILNYIIIQSIHIVLHNWQVLTLLLLQWKLMDVDTVSWNQTQSMMCGDTIVGYSLRYQLSGSSDYTTVNTSGTSVRLEDLAPNADYAVSVAAINSIGDLSAYSVISLNIAGMLSCVGTLSSTFTTHSSLWLHKFIVLNCIIGLLSIYTLCRPRASIRCVSYCDWM